MSGILFEIDGETVPVEDASWYEIAPCGCYCGVMVASSGGTVYADAETVWKHLVPNAEKRRRRQALGYRQELGHRKHVVKRLEGRCGHTPQWGVEKAPVPEGYRWARADGSQRGRRKHLVHGAFDDDRIYSSDHPSLCEAKAWCWSSKWYDVNEIAECVRCERLAKALVQS